MDQSEGQGLKIGLIISCVLFIASAVAAGVFYNKYDQCAQREPELTNAKNAALRERDEARQQYSELRLAVAGAEVKEDHQKFMESIGADLKQPSLSDARKAQTPQYKSYRDGFAFVHNELKRDESRIRDLEKSLADTQSQLKIVQSQYQAEKDQIEDARKKKEEERLTEVAKLLEINKQLESDRDAITQRFRTTQDELEQTRNKTSLDMKRAEQKIRELGLNIGKLTEQLTKGAEFRFEHEDGEVVTVLPDAVQAFVNVGVADGVRNGLTFGVYGYDRGGNWNVLPKASLEIVRMVDAHRSIGRITYLDRSQPPVVPGDKLYNPIWNRGDRESVAYIGLMHLDDDNVPDNNEFRRLVEELGGKIDAEMNLLTGQIVGRITVNTGWLVIGEIPDITKHEKDEKMVALINNLIAAQSALQGQAKDAGVRIIPLRNFLAYMGHNAPWRTVPAGEEYNFQKAKIRRALGSRAPQQSGAKSFDLSTTK
jgi:hypothetical protein